MLTLKFVHTYKKVFYNYSIFSASSDEDSNDNVPVRKNFKFYEEAMPSFNSNLSEDSDIDDNQKISSHQFRQPVFNTEEPSRKRKKKKEKIKHSSKKHKSSPVKINHTYFLF